MWRSARNTATNAACSCLSFRDALFTLASTAPNPPKLDDIIIILLSLSCFFGGLDRSWSRSRSRPRPEGESCLNRLSPLRQESPSKKSSFHAIACNCLLTSGIKCCTSDATTSRESCNHCIRAQSILLLVAKCNCSIRSNSDSESIDTASRIRDIATSRAPESLSGGPSTRLPRSARISGTCRTRPSLSCFAMTLSSALFWF